jgi:ABC-type transport system involved in multi-copper enzyme maturation permease subunit
VNQLTDALLNVLVIGRLTILEALRRRILRALALLTVVIVVLTGWGFGAIVGNAREHALAELEIMAGLSQLLILVAFMFSFVLAMTAAFLGSPAIAADLESGVLLAVAARPIRRAEILLGKWLGLTAIAVGYAVGAGLLEIQAAKIASGYAPPDSLGATLFLAAQATVLLTIAVLLSVRLPPIAGGAVAVVLFGLSWIAGVLVNIAGLLQLDSLARSLDLARYLLPLDGLWRGTVFALEPPAILLAASGAGGRAQRIVTNSPFYASSGPSTEFIVYVALWTVVVLALAIVSFRRREI